jgi:hypothetical protein
VPPVPHVIQMATSANSKRYEELLFAISSGRIPSMVYPEIGPVPTKEFHLFHRVTPEDRKEWPELSLIKEVWVTSSISVKG